MPRSDMAMEKAERRRGDIEGTKRKRKDIRRQAEKREMEEQEAAQGVF